MRTPYCSLRLSMVLLASKWILGGLTPYNTLFLNSIEAMVHINAFTSRGLVYFDLFQVLEATLFNSREWPVPTPYLPYCISFKVITRVRPWNCPGAQGMPRGLGHIFRFPLLLSQSFYLYFQGFWRHSQWPRSPVMLYAEMGLVLAPRMTVVQRPPRSMLAALETCSAQAPSTMSSAANQTQIATKRSTIIAPISRQIYTRLVLTWRPMHFAAHKINMASLSKVVELDVQTNCLIW